jgi:hypothetical protein
MSIRSNTTRRDKWRNRFLEIAQRYEAAGEPVQAPLSGLRPRARMAGFATVRRARLGASG